MNTDARGLIYIFVALVSAATIPVITKVALNHGGDPGRILLLRFFLVTIFLTIYMRQRRLSWWTSGKDLIGLIGLGFAYVNVSLLFFLAMKYISPSLGSLILYTYPTMVAVLSALFLNEAFTSAKTFALLFSVAGCFLVVGAQFEVIAYRGILLAFLTALFFSIYIVGNKAILKGVHPVVSLAYMSSFCFLFFGVKTLASGKLSLSYSTVDILSAFTLAVVPTIIGILALFKALEILGASKVAIISSFEPAVTLALAYFILDDRIFPLQIVGGTLILGSVLIVQKPEPSGKKSVLSTGHEVVEK